MERRRRNKDTFEIKEETYTGHHVYGKFAEVTRKGLPTPFCVRDLVNLMYNAKLTVKVHGEKAEDLVIDGAEIKVTKNGFTKADGSPLEEPLEAISVFISDDFLVLCHWNNKFGKMLIT